MLEYEIFWRKVILVGDNAGLQDKLLRRAEFGRGGDEVSGEAAGEEIARRASRKNEHADHADCEFDPAKVRHTRLAATLPLLAPKPRETWGTRYHLIVLRHSYFCWGLNDL